MAALYAQYPSPDGAAFSNDGLARLILELTGAHVSELMRNGIQGTALIQGTEAFSGPTTATPADFPGEQ